MRVCSPDTSEQERSTGNPRADADGPVDRHGSGSSGVVPLAEARASKSLPPPAEAASGISIRAIGGKPFRTVASDRLTPAGNTRPARLVG